MGGGGHAYLCLLPCGAPHVDTVAAHQDSACLGVLAHSRSHAVAEVGLLGSVLHNGNRDGVVVLVVRAPAVEKLRERSRFGIGSRGCGCMGETRWEGCDSVRQYVCEPQERLCLHTGCARVPVAHMLMLYDTRRMNVWEKVTEGNHLACCSTAVIYVWGCPSSIMRAPKRGSASTRAVLAHLLRTCLYSMIPGKRTCQ